MNCRICAGVTEIYKNEIRNEIMYTVVRCKMCGVYQTVEHYDNISPDYVDMGDEDLSEFHISMGREHKKKAYGQFVSLMDDIGALYEDEKILFDIGCGTGGFLEYINKKGVSAVGFDASVTQVNYARKNGLEAYVATDYDGIVRSVPGLIGGVNMVTLWDVFEHIRNPYRLLKDIKGLLRRDGYIYISVPNAGSLLWKDRYYKIIGKKFSLDPWEHVFYYNITSLKKMLDEIGYEVVRSGSVLCYYRNINISELVRRCVYSITAMFPDISPQIYVIARKR